MDPIRGANPFPPPPRRILGPALFFAMLATALFGAVYLGWSLIAGDSTSVIPSAPQPVAEAESQLATIVMQIAMFEKSVGRYPTEAEGLEALATRPASMPADVLWLRLRKDIPLDPWGRPFEYTEVPGDPPTFRVSSRGPNGDDPADDLSAPVAPAQPVQAATPAPGKTPYKPKFRL